MSDLLLLCDYVGRMPEKGAIPTINCAVNPVLNSQQAIYYTSNTSPEQASETAKYELIAIVINYITKCRKIIKTIV